MYDFVYGSEAEKKNEMHLNIVMKKGKHFSQLKRYYFLNRIQNHNIGHDLIFADLSRSKIC